MPYFPFVANTLPSPYAVQQNSGNMGVTKDKLLSVLQELQIDYSKYEHPVVLTVEAQAKYVGNLGGGLSKNLFLKDRKSRFYIVSALADTKVDLKVLSARLGLGKGGLRMAPEEALGEILQVPLGCVTPFTLANESARHVSLMLDQGFKSQERCFFHPLSNDMTISLNASDLDKFLKSIGRARICGLGANPSVGKDQPPDLASLVPSGSTSVLDPTENPTSSKGPSEKQIASTDIKSTKVTAIASKPSSNAQNAKDKLVKGINPSGSTTNVERFVEVILDRTSALLLSLITEETIKQHGAELGTVLSNSIKSHLSSEFNSTTMTFKNAAYVEGFYAGIHHHPKPTY